jgi:hypothetical protein
LGGVARALLERRFTRGRLEPASRLFARAMVGCADLSLFARDRASIRLRSDASDATITA